MKKLEIVVVIEGKILSQRTIPEGSPVGLQFAGSMAEQELFSYSDEGFCILRLTPGMVGRVAFGTETPPQVIEIETALRRMNPGTCSVKLALDDTARGKIEFGRTVILFRFKDEGVMGQALPKDVDELAAMRDEIMIERVRHCDEHYPENDPLSYLSLHLTDWFLLNTGDKLWAIEHQLEQLRNAGRRATVTTYC